MTEISFVMSAIALILYSLSYFFNNKKGFLISQLSGNVFLSVSYLIMGSYFTMISVLIGIARGLLCFLYERRDKKVPVYVVLSLCSATVISFVVINCIILSDASPWDILYLCASCMYSITFAMRNIKLMRYVSLVPHTVAVAYNLLIHAPFTSAISYAIELAVTVVAIIKFDFIGRKKK